MKWRVIKQQEGWVVVMLQGIAMVLDGEQVGPEKWAVVAGPFSTEAEAERERTRLESE